MATKQTWVCTKRDCDYVYRSPIKITGGASHTVKVMGKEVVHQLKEKK